MSDIDVNPTSLSPDALRAAVRDRYADAARQASRDAASCCDTSCCGGDSAGDPITSDLYDDVDAVDLGNALSASLGCGNPTLLAELRPGQTVLDLGSGAGLDVLLSARRVAPGGKAYGLDMTPEMLDLARRNQIEAGIENAEFLPGTMEEIPLPDASVDVVISNCVINLAADKDVVLSEAFRVLAPGGRFAVSDIVLLRPLPEPARRVMRLWTGCIAGALLDEDYVARLEAAGFVDASVEPTRIFGPADVSSFVTSLPAGEVPVGTDTDAVAASMAGAVASAFVRATKPL